MYENRSEQFIFSIENAAGEYMQFTVWVKDTDEAVFISKEFERDNFKVLSIMKKRMYK